MVLYLAAFVATMPKVFEGMLKIRIGYVSSLITNITIKTYGCVMDGVFLEFSGSLFLISRNLCSILVPILVSYDLFLVYSDLGPLQCK